MKIKLTEELTIAVEHGATKDAVFEVTKFDEVKDLYYFKGKIGIECAAYSSECEIIDNEPTKELKAHAWEKINNVTIRRGGILQDNYKCKFCNAKAKMIVLGRMEIDRRYSEYCKGQNF